MDQRERYRRIDELFAAALDREGAARDEVLAEATAELPDGAAIRREVERLLAADAEATGFLEPTSPDSSSSSAPVPRRFQAGDLLGPYRLVELVGEGGMGVVWLAERADAQFERRVAVKVLPAEAATPELVRRLEAERQFLAGLDHPHIARLYDGGTTEDGRPYLILEYVDGEPIDRYCERHDLPRRRRAELFADVCAAAHHAHRRNLVHRDLKPANVLVTEDGRVKLLDFGIAKLLAPDPWLGASKDTHLGLRPLTPAYASPEQHDGGPVGPASDVYSLGLVLRELTARGTPPRGDRDLDAVAAKALRPEPEDRYPDAGALAADVRRYLGGLPVEARRGRFRYRAARWVQRNRIAAATAVLLLLVGLGFAATTFRQQRTLSDERAMRGEAQASLHQLFETSDPTLYPGNRPRTALLREGVRILREDLAGETALQADLGQRLAQTLTNLAHYDLAETAIRETLVAREVEYGPHALETAESRQLAAEIASFRGDLPASLAASEQALAILRARSAEPQPTPNFSEETQLFTRTASFHARQRLALGQYDASDRARLQQAVERLGDHPYAYLPLHIQALGLRTGGDLIEARDLEALALERLEAGVAAKVLPEGQPLLAQAATWLAEAELRLGRTAAAAEQLEDARVLYDRALEADHPLWARWHMLRGRLAEETGERDDARDSYREALRIRRARLGEEHPDTTEALRALERLATG